MHCRRFREKEGESDAGESHGVCARCHAIHDKEHLFSRDELKEAIREELDAGIQWEGDDVSNYSDDEKKLYEELLAEVRMERGEGGVGVKR